MAEFKEERAGLPDRKRIRSFRDLIAWQKAMDMIDLVYKLTATFPREELFGLTTQMRKSCVSVASNMAEGYGRRRLPEYLRFVDISYGSNCELQTQVLVARRQNYLTPPEADHLDGVLDEVGRLVYRLRESLDKCVQEQRGDLRP